LGSLRLLRLLRLKEGQYSAPPSAFNLQPAHLSVIYRGKMPLQRFHRTQVDRFRLSKGFRFLVSNDLNILNALNE
jgi:hypothetical protein